MRIYQMTATFGKLEHETLTLEPGLNVIHAPNEWGKSTWCAFLIAMLYGLDTRAKSTKTTLADKERFAPWSGSPMAGRIDLRWNGRDITIERRTKGRIPLGEFWAYETATGISVPELTAANCGQELLGVEQSVFRRAGFIRLSDLPVTQDEALRRRLNALVTTGDESGDGERLAQNLRDLKNRCRYNRTGLLPQAEADRDALEEKLRELEALELQSRKLKQRLGEVKTWLRQLENHRTALSYAAAEADAEHVAQARDDRDRAVRQLEELESACARLPSREETQRVLQELRDFREQWNSVQMEAQMLPAPPQTPETPEPFRDMDAGEALAAAQADAESYGRLSGKQFLPLVLAGTACIIGAAVLLILTKFLPGAILLAAGLGLLGWGIWMRSRLNRQKMALEDKYGEADPAQWLSEAEAYGAQLSDYSLALQEYRAARGDLDDRIAALRQRRDALCGDREPERVLEAWQQAARRWDACFDARREAVRAESHLQAMQAMAKPARRPAMEDSLAYTEAETARLISDAEAEQQRLHSRIGQYQGRMESLGDETALKNQLEQVQERIRKLEDTYAALTIAQDTLAQARAELQRRFAPRISRRAQELLSALTGGRYDRLTLGEDFSLRAGAGEEDILHDTLWRSDGTVDQLYLALRLAVAEEVTPGAPLILDDALVRFDDERMKAALEILRKEAETKQVILFSCQGREQSAVGSAQISYPEGMKKE